jgi:hypothetical protein
MAKPRKSRRVVLESIQRPTRHCFLDSVAASAKRADCSPSFGAGLKESGITHTDPWSSWRSASLSRYKERFSYFSSWGGLESSPPLLRSLLALVPASDDDG